MKQVRAETPVAPTPRVSAEDAKLNRVRELVLRSRREPETLHSPIQPGTTGQLFVVPVDGAPRAFTAGELREAVTVLIAQIEASSETVLKASDVLKQSARLELRDVDVVLALNAEPLDPIPPSLLRAWSASNSNSFDATSFLQEVHALHSKGETDRALDAIFCWFDDELRGDRKSSCERALRMVDVDAFDEDLLVGFLSATFAARRFLPARAELVERVRVRLSREIGAAETNQLLRELS